MANAIEIELEVGLSHTCAAHHTLASNGLKPFESVVPLHDYSMSVPLVDWASLRCPTRQNGWPAARAICAKEMRAMISIALSFDAIDCHWDRVSVDTVVRGNTLNTLPNSLVLKMRSESAFG